MYRVVVLNLVGFGFLVSACLYFFLQVCDGCFCFGIYNSRVLMEMYEVICATKVFTRLLS